MSQEGKKKFEKQTVKFCQSQERYLSLSTKKQDNVLQEVINRYLEMKFFIHHQIITIETKKFIHNKYPLLFFRQMQHLIWLKDTFVKLAWNTFSYCKKFKKEKSLNS